MSSRNFITGIGMGLIAGSALGMLVSPRTRQNGGTGGRSMVGRCLKSMGNVIDDVSEALK